MKSTSVTYELFLVNASSFTTAKRFYKLFRSRVRDTLRLYKYIKTYYDLVHYSGAEKSSTAVALSLLRAVPVADAAIKNHF